MRTRASMIADFIGIFVLSGPVSAWQPAGRLRCLVPLSAQPMWHLKSSNKFPELVIMFRSAARPAAIPAPCRSCRSPSRPARPDRRRGWLHRAMLSRCRPASTARQTGAGAAHGDARPELDLAAAPVGFPKSAYICDLGRWVRHGRSMMIIRVPSPALPDPRPPLRQAHPVLPLVGVEERGTAGAAARGRCTPPHQAPAPGWTGLTERCWPP